MWHNLISREDLEQCLSGLGFTLNPPPPQRRREGGPRPDLALIPLRGKKLKNAKYRKIQYLYRTSKPDALKYALDSTSYIERVPPTEEVCNGWADYLGEVIDLAPIEDCPHLARGGKIS